MYEQTLLKYYFIYTVSKQQQFFVFSLFNIVDFNQFILTLINLLKCCQYYVSIISMTAMWHNAWIDMWWTAVMPVAT